MDIVIADGAVNAVPEFLLFHAFHQLSYFGFTQIAAAAGAPAHLKAICPFMCCSLASFGTSPMQTVATFHLNWAYAQLLEHAGRDSDSWAGSSHILPASPDFPSGWETFCCEIPHRACNGGNEQEDGHDAVEYLAAQPFCDGNVGMFGLSYFGFTQIAAAAPWQL